MKSFCLQVSKYADQHCEDKLQGRNVWRGVASPRAELLLWFILQQRLNAKDRLCKLNCISPGDSLCCFFSAESESVEHLFFACPVSLNLWYACMNWWNLV